MWRIARYLPEAKRQQAFVEGYLVAREFDDPDERAWALCKVAPHLPQSQQDEAWTEALTAAREIKIGYYRAIALAAVSVYLPQPQGDQTLTEAFGVARALTRKTGPVAAALGKAARYVFRHVPEHIMAEGLTLFHAAEVAVVDPNDTEAMNAVEELVEHLVQYLPKRLLTEALTAARNLPSEYSATRFLGHIALYLPEPHREQALTEALTPARETTTARRAILAHLHRIRGTHISSDDMAIVRRCLDTLGLDDCFSVLATAIPIIRDAGGTPALDNSLRAIHTVQRWWHSPPANPDEPGN